MVEANLNYLRAQSTSVPVTPRVMRFPTGPQAPTAAPSYAYNSVAQSRGQVIWAPPSSPGSLTCPPRGIPKTLCPNGSVRPAPEQLSAVSADFSGLSESMGEASGTFEEESQSTTASTPPLCHSASFKLLRGEDFEDAGAGGEERPFGGGAKCNGTCNGECGVERRLLQQTLAEYHKERTRWWSERVELKDLLAELEEENEALREALASAQEMPGAFQSRPSSARNTKLARTALAMGKHMSKRARRLLASRMVRAMKKITVQSM